MRKHLVPAFAVAVAACGHPAAAPQVATCAARVSSPAARCGLVLNEVAAAGRSDDWFEVVNTSGGLIDLSDYAYVDTPGALDRARAFPAFTLEPGERHVQHVSTAIDGFQLGGDEALWIYRADGTPEDHADWDKGDSPAGGSYAREPDVTGAFTAIARDTEGSPNS